MYLGKAIWPYQHHMWSHLTHTIFHQSIFFIFFVLLSHSLFPLEIPLVRSRFISDDIKRRWPLRQVIHSPLHVLLCIEVVQQEMNLTPDGWGLCLEGLLQQVVQHDARRTAPAPRAHHVHVVAALQPLCRHQLQHHRLTCARWAGEEDPWRRRVEQVSLFWKQCQTHVTLARPRHCLVQGFDTQAGRKDGGHGHCCRRTTEPATFCN